VSDSVTAPASTTACAGSVATPSAPPNAITTASAATPRRNGRVLDGVPAKSFMSLFSVLSVQRRVVPGR